MRMKPKTLAGLIILFLFLAMIPPVSGNGWPEEQTRHIIVHPLETGTDGDWFVTEAGLGFSTSLVTVLDPNMDIYGYLFFKDIKLNSYFFLENATLRLRTASTLDFDNESSFTIYGINDYRYFGMGDWGYGSPAQIMSAPLTSAHVVYNSSEFYGPQWWDINVTNIVQEIKSNPWYEGPGLDYSDPGDYMAFIILGAGGYDSRWFYDVSVGNDLEAQLHIHWDFSPPPPSGYPTAIFNETYGNYTIWEMPGGLGYPLEPIEYVFTNGSASPYIIKYDDSDESGPYVISNTELADATAHNVQRKITRQDNGTLYAIYRRELVGKKQIYVKKSADEGETWTDETRVSTNPAKNMDNYNQGHPAIAVDSTDSLHAVWAGRDDDYSSLDVIWYSKYTDSWSTPVMLSIVAVYYSPYTPSIAIDSENNIHIVYTGEYILPNPHYRQIFYLNYTDSWSTPIGISKETGKESHSQIFASIEIDSLDNLHVVFQGGLAGSLWIRYMKYTDSWSTSIPISTTVTDSTASLAIDSNDHLFVTYGDDILGGSTGQIIIREFDGSWLDQVRVSNYTGMQDLPQVFPSIATDSNDYIHVVWHGKATGYGDEAVWYTLNNGSWQMPPIPLQSPGKNAYANLRWSRWPEVGPSTYVVADANGTVLVEDLDTVDDAEDWIDDYDPDPEDPDPAGVWSEGPGGETGAFTRFRMRLWFLIIGFGCFFGPVLFFAWRRPSGYYLMAGSIVMLIGLGLLMSIAQV